MTVQLRDLTKRYGSTMALDSVSLTIRSGEVHALLGHNGAGKSTLIRLLGGGTAPTSGSIQLDDQVFTELDPRTAIRQGIAVIYQHLSLVDTLSVAENLFLGQEVTRGRLIRRSEQARLARQALDAVGAQCSPGDVVGRLPMGQRQLVEIAKALQRDARLLVLDEPTAALSAPEAENLGRLVVELKQRGLAILYVTHLLGEVTRLADEVTVLRNGAAVWHSRSTPFTRPTLVAAITGGESSTLRRHEPSPRPEGEPVLSLRDVRARSIGPVSLDVRPGEIVGLYGLMGAGRTRLLETVYGCHPVTGGRVTVDGADFAPSGPAAALKDGVALVPADRGRQGLFGTMAAIENVLVRGMGTLANGALRSRAKERRVFEGVAAGIALRPHEPDLPAGSFSGGNQQKLLLARWVNSTEDVRVLLLDDPTQGVDVGARADIYAVVRRLAAEKGIAVLFASSEPDEVMALADRCVLMRGGEVVGVLETSETDEEALLAFVHAPDGGEGIAA